MSEPVDALQWAVSRIEESLANGDGVCEVWFLDMQVFSDRGVSQDEKPDDCHIIPKFLADYLEDTDA